MKEPSASFKRVFGSNHSFARIIIDETVAFIERWELFIPNWYEDGKWKTGPKQGQPRYSCCFGHLEGGDHPPFEYVAGQTFTIEEGRAILKLDMASKANFVNKKLTAPVTTFMFGSFISLCYQFGQGRLQDAEDGFRREHDVYGNETKVPIKPIIPFLLMNDGKYIDGILEMEKLNFITDGSYSKGHHVRRACEIALCMTKK